MNTQQLWQAQALDAPRISLAFVRQQSDSLRRRTQMRNAFEYIGGAACLAFIAWKSVPLISSRPLFSLATAMWAVGTLVFFVLWDKRAASQEQPAEFGVLDALKFHRLQLERQRDARRGNWRWWLPLYLPGVVMLFVAMFVDFTPVPWTAIILMGVWLVFGFWMMIVMYERSARRIQKEIDALDSL
jgi:amino acid transporter